MCYVRLDLFSNSVKENRQLALTASCSSSSLSLVHSHSSSVGSTVPVTISRLCNTHKTGTGAWKKQHFSSIWKQICQTQTLFRKLTASTHVETHTRDTHSLSFTLSNTHTHTYRETGAEGITAAIIQWKHQSEHLSLALEIAMTDNGTVDCLSMQFSF